ncbi:hypothetical protein A3A39_03795 [Candidatus Kaiserbacteria bacterium RIFCSPLOWO2_01_FULL_54_13]|uniref:MGS-like domain-containing protein n=1 Tax=Candidatus Kaiserbacteria bacterium RIFCSPLOWO2_01_FULL_54_13 TaxID=1798512 RepID=A0A1F6F213_9BACT|nr:MAG: hypothetical protein A3A39_03795 [Candidatus Kaiserbacteria bacterium RIFCSPLOWO2_01_FULL_54_13]
MNTALLASYEKDAPLLRLGKLLKENSWTLLGSAGTAKYLYENGVGCRDVAEIVGPPILGHRVVTLSRELHAALLATSKDLGELKDLDIEPIDLVYVTLYPLEKTAAVSNAKPDDVLEKTDIGGPTLLRAAAKGRKIVLSSPKQLDEFEVRLKSGTLGDENYRMALAAAAERRVADYVDASARYLESKTS